MHARRIPDDEIMDDEFAEAWSRLTDEPEVRGVNAERWRDEDTWPWQLTVWAMEFVRDDPLESEIRTAVAAAIRSVAGVNDVQEEDREVWVIEGSPNGGALVDAVAEVIDGFAPRIRAYMPTLPVRRPEALRNRESPPEGGL